MGEQMVEKSASGMDLGKNQSYEDSLREQYFHEFMSRDVLAREQFLIQHGVRHVVICGYIDKDEESMSAMLAMLRYTPTYGCGEICDQAIPFVIPGPCNAICGYASHPWIIETLDWVYNNVEGPHRSRLMGMLLGYHPDAIELDGHMYSGRRFSTEAAPVN